MRCIIAAILLLSIIGCMALPPEPEVVVAPLPVSTTPTATQIWDVADAFCVVHQSRAGKVYRCYLKDGGFTQLIDGGTI